jgi:hypothetical protein
VVDVVKLWNSYISIGMEDTKSPISCFLFYIWLCFVILQVTMFNIVFQWSGLGELVSMMEQKPCCLINNLYGECESWFLEIINIVVSREGRWGQGRTIWNGMRRTKSMAFIPNCSLFLLKNSTTSQFEDRILVFSPKVFFFSNLVHVFCYAMSIRRN